MRCNNCGWDNSPNQIMCEKCSEALSAVSPSEQARPIAPPPPTGKAFLKGTIRGATANKPFIDNPNVPPKKTLRMEEKTCPACQAPVRAEFTQCPYCQNPLGETPKVQDTIAEKPPQEKPIIKPKVIFSRLGIEVGCLVAIATIPSGLTVVEIEAKTSSLTRVTAMFWLIIDCQNC